MAISSGDQVQAIDSRGQSLVLRALTGPTAGKDFTVVWVCTEDDWVAAGGDPESVQARLPWPSRAVRELVTH